MPKGKRITHIPRQKPKPKPAAASSHVSELMPSHALDGADFERWVVQTAAYFSMAYRAGPGNNVQEHYNKLSEAIAAKRAYDKKPAKERHSRLGMVYAVNAAGRRAMLSEKQYPEMLKLRGES